MKVNKVQQGGPILFVAKDKPGKFLIMRKGNYRQASFHHAHMIRVRYLLFDMWVDQCLGTALTWTSIPLMINPYCKHPQLQKKY